MPRTTFPWLQFAMNAARLGIESQAVIGLRLMKLAGGGAAASREAERMVMEKGMAMVAAQVAMATSVMAGRADLAPERAVAIYRRTVRANRRRLAR